MLEIAGKSHALALVRLEQWRHYNSTVCYVHFRISNSRYVSFVSSLNAPFWMACGRRQSRIYGRCLQKNVAVVP